MVISYGQAKVNEKSRQEYLDSLMDLCTESVHSLVYDPCWLSRDRQMEVLIKEGYVDDLEEVKRSKNLHRDSEFIIVFSPLLLGIKRKYPIFVSRKVFKKKNENYFLNALIDHEVYHAEDFVNGFYLNENLVVDNSNVEELSKRTIINLRELRAYRNQLKKARERGLDKSYLIYLKWGIDTFLEALNSINPKSDFEKLVLENI